MVFLLITLLACSKPDNQVTNKAEKIAIQDLQPGNVKHQLTEQQITRVKKLQQSMAEVYSVSLDEWIDGFSRDINPDSEISIWENIESAYQQYCKDKKLDIDTKKEVFGILLVRSSSTEEEMLKDLKLKNLTLKDAKEVLSLYKEKPKPIQITKEK